MSKYLDGWRTNQPSYTQFLKKLHFLAELRVPIQIISHPAASEKNQLQDKQTFVEICPHLSASSVYLALKYYKCIKSIAFLSITGSSRHGQPNWLFLTILMKMRSHFIIVIDMANKISAKLTLFLLALKNSNADRGITFDDFITELRPLNKGKVGRFEFLKIVQRINSGGSSFDAMQLFAELAPDGDAIAIDSFNQLYAKLARLSNQRMENPKEKEYQQQMEEEDKNRKLARMGFERLLKYVNAKNNLDPNQIFADCDKDGSGDIDKNELNKFLVASEIEQFKDKTIRRLIINDIFSKFPSARIKKDDFFNLFQVPKERIGKKNRTTPNNGNRNYSKKNVTNPEEFDLPTVDDLKKSRNIRINTKKKEEPQQPEAKKQQPEAKKQQPPEKQKPVDKVIDERQYFEGYHADFPLASNYYRMGVPSTDELAFIEELDRMLKNNKIFLDPKNPEASGTYVYANEIFQQQNYELIGMTASAINRNRGKKEIAQFIEAKDIKQGSIGDCYFMSAISSLAASYPQLLSEKFLFEVNPAHYYGVRLFIDGEWRIMKTDDEFPCQYNQVLYAKPNANEIWVMLLEKAFAKAFGSYRAIQNGNMQESFFLLTGAPQEIITMKTSEREATVRRIFEASEKGFILGTSGNDTLSRMGKTAENQLGLVGNHAYSLLSVHKVGSETLLKLRNPWGHTVWKGAWSFESREWTPELRKQFDVETNPNDGSFYMNWKDYEKYFGSINICQLNPIYLHTSLRMVNNRRKSNYVQMKITTAGTYNIFTCQENQRKSSARQKYSAARLIISRRSETGSYQFIASQNCNWVQTCSIEASFDKGTYLISAKVFWNEWTDHECFLVAYGPERVAFEKADRAVAPRFKEDVVASFARVMKGSASVTSFESYGYKNVLQEVLMDLPRGIGFVKTINKSAREFHCKEIFTMKGMKIIKPKCSPYQFSLPPGKENILGFFLSAAGFSYSKSQSFWQ